MCAATNAAPVRRPNARSRAAHFTQGAEGLRQWAQAIADAQPDVLIYPEIGELVSGILKRKKHIYLCTNGVFLEAFGFPGQGLLGQVIQQVTMHFRRAERLALQDPLDLGRRSFQL